MTMRIDLLILAILLVTMPTVAADNHTISDQEETGGNWEVEDILQWHCVGAHIPVHCGNATYVATTGKFTAGAEARSSETAAPIPVTGDSSLALSVSYDGPSGATADVTVTVEDASGIAFTTRTLTKTVTAGTPVAFDFPFLLMPDWPAGDLVGPRVLMEIPGEGSAETYVPMVLRPVEVDRPWYLPLGPGVALVALVVAALVLARRRT